MSVPTEHVEQVTFINEFKKIYPGVRIFAIPNGGFRHKSVAEKLKAEGVSPGVPDLFVPAMKTFIEMKRTVGGRLSTDQKDWIEYLESVGFRVIVAKGWKHGIEQL